MPMLTWLPIFVARQRSCVPLAGPPVSKKVVDEHRAVRNETVVADRDQIADEGVRWIRQRLPIEHPVLNFDKRPDEDVRPQCATVKVDRLDDGDVLAEVTSTIPDWRDRSVVRSCNVVVQFGVGNCQERPGALQDGDDGARVRDAGQRAVTGCECSRGNVRPRPAAVR